MEKICCQIIIAASMQPLLYDLQSPVAKIQVLRTQRRHQATWTQPLQCVLQHHVANTHLSTHMATEHDNNRAAITLQSCNQIIKKRIELHRHEQSLVAEHRGGTNRGQNDPNRTRRTHEAPLIAGCSHFTQGTIHNEEKHKGKSAGMRQKG